MASCMIWCGVQPCVGEGPEMLGALLGSRCGLRQDPQFLSFSHICCLVPLGKRKEEEGDGGGVQRTP